MNNYKYSLNKRCSICSKLIKKDTICNDCYKKLEEFTFNNDKSAEPIHCLNCGLIIGFNDMIRKVNLKYCNTCFQLIFLNKRKD